VITASELEDAFEQARADAEVTGRSITELVRCEPVTAHPDDTLREIVYRMAETHLSRFPVVDRDDPRRLLGIVSLYDLLHARVRSLAEESQRERVLRLHTLLPRRAGGSQSEPAA
jgi:CBS domain-containing protein